VRRLEVNRGKEKSNRDRKSATGKKPNILVFWGDDIGISNLSCCSHGLMGYHTPNIEARPAVQDCSPYESVNIIPSFAIRSDRPGRCGARSSFCCLGADRCRTTRSAGLAPGLVPKTRRPVPPR
jgi:hypothetical protein